MTDENRARGCWCCGETAHELFMEATLDAPMTADDVRITDRRYGTTGRLVRCLNCGFIYSSPLLADDLVALYAALDDPDYNEGLEYRTLQMERLLDQILESVPEATSLLDVGAGNGLLVAAAMRRGLRSVGVEPSQLAVEWGRRELGVTVHAGTYPHPDIGDTRFDLVTAVDVIEHVSDPIGLLRSLRDGLAPGGRLVLTSPDIASVAARALGPRWWHVRAAHVAFFDKDAMDHALARVGLVCERRVRQTWWFSIGYLATRVSSYLPAPLASLGERLGTSTKLAPITDRVIPLNLFDSWVYICREATP